MSSLDCHFQAHLDLLSSTACSQSRLLYGGVCSSSRVCAGVCEGVSIVSCNKTGRIDIRSIDD